MRGPARATFFVIGPVGMNGTPTRTKYILAYATSISDLLSLGWKVQVIWSVWRLHLVRYERLLD